MKFINSILCLSLLLVSSAYANDRNRDPNTPQNIKAAWALLDCGMAYKELLIEGRKDEGQGISYNEMVENLRSNPNNPDCTDQTHQEYLYDAIATFQALLDSGYTGDALEQVQWGLQESFSTYAEARLVLGNDLMINGLRARFTSTEEIRISPIEYLGLSVEELKRGLDNSLPILKQNADILRTQGDGPLPFMVYNTHGAPTNNEYMQFTELLNRYGMAAVSEAKYFYYKDNVKDIDNPPYNNFPGIEDLDFNRDNIENSVGRNEAAKRAKTAASNLYLQGVVLAALQDPDTFQTNNGYQLKRQLNDADRLYGDIQSGFNPLQLAGDFVPYQKVENFLQLARSRVTDADTSEKAAKAANRSLEVDQTAFAAELLALNTQYIDQIEELTGLSTAGYTLSEQEDRDRYRADALQSTAIGGRGQIGLQYYDIQDALIAASSVNRQLLQIPERIQIEEQRNDKATSIILSTGEKMAALSFASAIANCCSVSISGPPVGYGISFNPAASLAGAISAQMSLTQSVQQARLDDVASEAAIKNILLEQAILYTSLEQAKNDIDRQSAVLETQWANLDRLLANYAVAVQNHADAYFSNPAYRLEATRAEQAAEDDFETALEFSYYAAKALEYMWSEKFNNPVLRLDGGMPEPLAVSFDPFMRAESVFSAQFAARINPSLDSYLDALQAWDVKMRQLRSPGRQTATVRLSLRDDILGLSQYAPEVAEAKFASMVSEGRYLGENPENPNLQIQFTLNIADESLFPAHPNIKIEALNANMVSTAARSIRGDSSTSPALIDFVMLDRAHVRTFFAEYPKRDDMLSYQLQGGRSIDQSPFIATVESTIDGYASPQATANTQLANHSPAVSTWVMRIKNNRHNNKKLKLEYLSDIELEIQYSFGKPRDIQFFN